MRRPLKRLKRSIKFAKHRLQNRLRFCLPVSLANLAELETIADIIADQKEYIDLSYAAADGIVSFDKQTQLISSELLKHCEKLSYIPETNTVLMTNVDMQNIFGANETISENISSILKIDVNTTKDAINDYFGKHIVIVQPKGLAGGVYVMGQWAQTLAPAYYTHQVVSMSSLLGNRGLYILGNRPLLAVAICTSGGLFFNGLGVVLGNNTAGNCCKTIGWALNRPMKGVEIVLNNLVCAPITAVTGLPLIFNYSDVQNEGPGINVTKVKEICQRANRNYGKKAVNWGLKQLHARFGN